MSYPCHFSLPLLTAKGTPYFQEPGVVMISAPYVNTEGMEMFLDGFDKELQFTSYLDDRSPVIDDGSELCKVAGQLCYLSFGPGHTTNAAADRYFNSIRESGHGSVLEHANYSFLFYGVSRSFTHELVRHRAGCAFSQVSQRYVSGKTLRFVERPEYQADDDFHLCFETSIDRAAEEYDNRAAALLSSMSDLLATMPATDRRKAVNQAARSCLPNETEAPIIMTANVRALRHIIEMRGSKYAEPEIRRVAVLLYRCMVQQSPLLFADYYLETLPDGSQGVDTKTRKV